MYIHNYHYYLTFYYIFVQFQTAEYAKKLLTKETKLKEALEINFLKFISIA